MTPHALVQARRAPHCLVAKWTLALATLLLTAKAIGAQSASAPPERQVRQAQSDTVREQSGEALGLPRVAFDSIAGVLGVVDTLDAPTLGGGAGIAPLAGRVAGAHVYWPSGAAGAPPTVELFGRTSLDRSGAPLYVLDGVPLAGSLMDVDLDDLDRIEVRSGAVGTRWLGSLGRDGVVQLRRARPPIPARGIFIEARSRVGSAWAPPMPGMNRSHAFRVNANGEYVDADGNVVSREERELDPSGIADSPYPGGTFDPHSALLAPGLLHSTSAVLAGTVAGAQLTAGAGRDREEGVLRGGDGYERLYVRGSAEHRLAQSLLLSFTGYHAWSKLDGAEGDPLFIDLNVFPADIDLAARTDDGGYVSLPDTSLFARNPLYVLSALETPLDARRSILGTQARWRPLAWISVHAALGYDRTRTYGSEVGGPDGFPIRVLNDYSSSLRTLALAASGERPMGPFDARFAIGGTSGRFREWSLERAGSPDAESRTETSLGLDNQVYSAHAGLRYKARFAFDASVRRETGGLLPVDDAVFDHHLGLAWFPTAESWWRWSGIDHMALRVSQRSQSSVDRTYRGFSGALSTTLKPERELSREIALDLQFAGRFGMRVTHERSTTRDALAVVPVASPTGFASRLTNMGDLARHSLTLSIGGELVRSDRGGWTMTLSADRNRLQVDGLDGPCLFTRTSERRCAGVVAGQLYGQRWISSHSQLPAQHAGSHAAFVVNDDGLLVPVGAGGSLTDMQYGTTVTIDGVTYEWGMPLSVNDVAGLPPQPIANTNPAISLGVSNVLRWRSFTLAATLAGSLGGDVYDRASQHRYLWGTHEDVDQASKPEALRKPLAYYARLGSPAVGYSSWFVRDGSRVTLEELAVNYRLSLGNRTIAGVDAVELSLIGRNLATWSPHSWIGGGPTGTWPVLDDLRYPRTRTLTIQIGATR